MRAIVSGIHWTQYTPKSLVWKQLFCLIKHQQFYEYFHTFEDDKSLFSRTLWKSNWHFDTASAASYRKYDQHKFSYPSLLSVQWHAATSNSNITWDPIKCLASSEPRPSLLSPHPALSWCSLWMQLSWRWKRAQRPLVALLPWKSLSQPLPLWSKQNQRSLFSTADSITLELRSSIETIAYWSWLERFPAAIISKLPGDRSHRVRQTQVVGDSGAGRWNGLVFT